MAVLLGSYTHNLDQGNRLAIPSKLRDELGEKFVLCIPLNGDRCLFAYSLEDWKELMDKFNDQPSSHKLTMLQRKLSKNADTVVVNNKGRISIPAPFMEAAGLENEIFILGAGRRVEFWNPKEWANVENVLAEDDDDLTYDFAF